MRRQRVLVDLLPLPPVDDGVNLTFRVHLDRGGDRAALAVVQEVSEGDDVGRPIGEHRSSEVALLRPELRGRGELGNEVRDEVVLWNALELDAVAELLRQAPRENPGVVAKAADRAGRAPDAMLPETGRPLHRVAGEERTGQADALPVRREGGNPPVAHGGEPELGQIEERRSKAGGGDGDVGLEDELARFGGALRNQAVAGVGALDPLDGGVERERPAAPRRILEGLEIADADGCEGEDAGLDRPRGDEDYLARPRFEAVRELEPRVALTDDEDALALVCARLLRLGVVRRLFDAGDRRLPGIRDADGEDDGSSPILPVRGDEGETVLLAAGRLPRAAVAHRDAGAIGEAGEPPFHLGP